MKAKYFLSALVLLGVAALDVSSALAQNAGWYAGAGVGRSKVSLDTSGLSGTTKETDTVWNVFGGYDINKNIGVELGYYDLGNTSFNGVTTVAFTAGGLTVPAGTSAAINLDAKAFAIAAIGKIPVTDSFSIHGRLGVASAKTNASVVLGTLAGSVSNTNTDITYGLGVRFDFNKQFAIRGEWERFRAGGGNIGSKYDVDVLSINAMFKF